MNFKRYKNKYNGQRCFIIGNAPSLQQENLSLLQNEKIFICNKGYNALDIGLPHFDFYVLADAGVGRYNIEAIQNNITTPKFLSSVVTRKLPELADNSIQYQRTKTKLRKDFPKTFETGWGKAASVVIDAAIIAFFMGFSEIYLLGVDLDYSPSNTHFYKDDAGDKQQRIMDTHFVLNNAKAIGDYFLKNNSKLINLSKGFKESSFISTGRLEDLF
jgi:hypothetical protein